MNRITEINEKNESFQVGGDVWLRPQALALESFRSFRVGDEVVISSQGGLSCVVENKTKGITVDCFR